MCEALSRIDEGYRFARAAWSPFAIELACIITNVCVEARPGRICRAVENVNTCA
jgi:hypothetical protein